MTCTKSGLPASWLELAPDPPPPVVAAALSTEVDDTATTARTEAATEPARRRRWSLRRRGRESAVRDASARVDLDLVTRGVEDEHVWCDRSLAALEEPDLAGSSAMPGAEAFEPVEAATDDPWSALADELAVRELQAQIRSAAEREHAVLARRQELEGRQPTAPTEQGAPIDTITDLATGEAGPERLELEDEFWAEGSNMSPGWLHRRKHREEQEAAFDDEPMEMLDLSAYDVPPERRGAFRDAVAAGGDAEAEHDWVKTARDLPS